MDVWYYCRGGQQYGPAELSDLRIMAANGELEPNDQVWKEGMPKWMPARRVAGLFPGTTGQPPQPRPPLQASPADSYRAHASAVPTSIATKSPPADRRGEKPPRRRLLFAGAMIGIGIACVGGTAFWLGTRNSARPSISASHPDLANKQTDSPPAEEAAVEAAGVKERAKIASYADFVRAAKQLRIRLATGITHGELDQKSGILIDAYSLIEDPASPLMEEATKVITQVKMAQEYWDGQDRVGISDRDAVPTFLAGVSKAIDKFQTEYEARQSDPGIARKPNAIKQLDAIPGGDTVAAGMGSPSNKETAKKLFEDGARNRDGHKGDAAIRAFQRSAELGNVDAMNALGLCYKDGLGVQAAGASAIQWFEKASNAGCSESTYHLGNMYCRGDGVPKDEARGFALLLASAQAGYGMAMTNVGACYQEGHGTERNAASAVEWFRRGAAAHEPAAMFNLGLMYGKGDGVARDVGEAKKWFHQAAQAGSHDAAILVAQIDALSALDQTTAAGAVDRTAATNTGAVAATGHAASAELFRTDPVASFKTFSKGFVSAAGAAKLSDDRQMKIGSGYSVDLKKTDSLVSPFVGTLEGDLVQYEHGRKVSDVSTIGKDRVRFSTRVRCTFAAQDGKWQMQDVEVNPWGGGWVSVLGDGFNDEVRQFWRGVYDATPNP